METKKRLVSTKCNVGEILNSRFIKEEGWTSNYLLIGEKKVFRINIIGTLVEKQVNEQNIRMGLDDKTGNINLTIFEKLPNLDSVNVGDVVLVIGKPKLYGEEKYILPEIIKKIEPEWLKVRSKEICSVIVEKPKEVKVEDVEETPDEISIIKKLDKGNGVDHEVLLKEIEEKNIMRLLENGEIFEIKPGTYKVLE